MVFTNVCLHHWQIDKSAASMELDWYLNRSKNLFSSTSSPLYRNWTWCRFKRLLFFCPWRERMRQSTLTAEEKFVIDLQGYIVIPEVLTKSEVSQLNKYIDQSDRQGKPSLWGDQFKNLIDHPKILPYLLELLGPYVRLDHDYAIFMDAGTSKGGLHGGPDVVGDHWYKYRDGTIRNGLSVMTFALSDVNQGNGGFACIPGSHKTNMLRSVPGDVRQFKRDTHYVVQPTMNAGDVLFFTEALIHGTKPWTANHERRSLLYKYSPGHSAWNINYPNEESYGQLTERQKRMLLPPSIGNRPRVDEL